MSVTPAAATTPEKTQKSATMRKIAMGIGAIFIALIFLSSYYTLRNLSTTSTTTSAQNKTTAPSTVYGVATANAVIYGYNDTFGIGVACINSSSTVVDTKVSQFVSELEQNNSLYNSYSLPNATVIQAGNMNTSSLYGFFSKNLNSTAFSCLNFNADAEILLPSQLNVYITNRTYTLTVPSDLRQSSVPVTLSENMSQTVRVRVSALVTSNGTIYSLNATKLK